MKKFYLLLLLLSPIVGLTQTNQAYNGFCTSGAFSSVTQGLNSTNTLQTSYGSCQVAVYLTGTTNFATIYSKSSGGPTNILGNPFTASTDGKIQFFIAAGTTVDVTMSGGIGGPSGGGIPAPYTISAITIGGGSGGGGSGNPGGVNLQFQFNNSGAFGGSTFLWQNTVFGPISQGPMIDVRSPNFGTLSGCLNSADPLGILDSTCAINAAITYAQTIYGTGASSRPMPCIYIPAGTYTISGQIVTTNQWKLCGDGPESTFIVQTNVTSNVITVRPVSSLSPIWGPNKYGWAGGGGIFNLAVLCSVSGTQGQPYNGCTGNGIEVEGTDFTVSNVTCTNWGGRCIMTSSAAEQIYFDRLWQNTSRWCISSSGQANFSARDIYCSTPGQDQTYVFGSYAHLGYPISTNWQPTTVTLNSASLDGNGNATIVVTSSDLTHGYTPGHSSPVPPGEYITLSGITDPNLSSLNGTFQVNTESGASGSPWTLTFTTYTQASGQWIYNDNDEPLWFCGNNTTCPITMAAAYSVSSPAGTFQVAAFPAINSSININTTAGSSENIRIDLIRYANGWVDSSAGDSVTAIYEECVLLTAPCLQRGFTAGGNVPYTTLTQATSASNSLNGPVETKTVNNTRWFPIVTGDPTNATSVQQSAVNIAVFPCDYNPNQTGVPSVCVSGVNTNQFEIMLGALDTQGHLNITFRNKGGSTAPLGTIWPIGSLVDTSPFISPRSSISLDQQRFADLNQGTNNFGFFNAMCSDTGPNTCATILDGNIPNLRTRFPLLPAVPLDLHNLNFPQSAGQDSNSVNIGQFCVKIMGSASVTIDGVSSSNGVGFNPYGILENGPAISNGIARHILSSCVLVPPQKVNGVLTLPTVNIYDSTMHSTYSCTGTALGTCFLDTDTRSFNNVASFGGPSPISSINASPTTLNTFTGHTFTGAWDLVDQAGFSTTASITAWSLPALTSSTFNNLTLNTTLNPGNGNCVAITGLTVGAIFNSSYNGYNYCYRVQSSTATQTVVNIPPLIPPASLPLSSTESGTITLYKPSIRFNMQGGPNSTGTNVGWDFDIYSGTGNTWNQGLTLRQDAVQGVLDINDLTSTNWTFNGTLNIVNPLSNVGFITPVNLDWTYAGVGTNLATYSHNIGNTGTNGWTAISMTITQNTTDLTAPDGTNTATKAVLTAGTNGALKDINGLSLISGQVYSMSFYAQGTPGDNTLLPGLGNVNAPGVLLTNSWQKFCVQLTPTGTLTNTAYFITTVLPTSHTYYVWGVSVVPGSICSIPFPTGSNPMTGISSTLAAANLTGTLTDTTQGIGIACFNSSGILTSSGCAASYGTRSWSLPSAVFATATVLGSPYFELNGASIKAIAARLSGAITCSVAPTVVVLDLGTAVTTSYAGATTLQSLSTGTAVGAFSTSGLNVAIPAGHYIGIGLSAGTCATAPQIDTSITVQ